MVLPFLIPILAGVGGVLLGTKASGGGSSAPASSNALIEVGTSKKSSVSQTEISIQKSTQTTFSPTTTNVKTLDFAPQFIFNSPNAIQSSKKSSELGIAPQINPTLTPTIIPTQTGGAIVGKTSSLESISNILPIVLIGGLAYFLLK